MTFDFGVYRGYVTRTTENNTGNRKHFLCAAQPTMLLDLFSVALWHQSTHATLHAVSVREIPNAILATTKENIPQKLP